MPEYLTPGVFVEETSARGRAIEGVATSTTGFLGAAPTGPLERPVALSSAAEFLRDFGDLETPLGRAVAAFFEAGGRHAVIVRVKASKASFKRALAALAEADAPLLVLPPPAPGVDVPAWAWAAAARFARQHQRFLIVDGPAAWSAGPRVAAALGIAAADAGHCAVYFPDVLRATPEGPPRREPPGGLVAGVIARTDAAAGVWKAPAGMDARLPGVVGLTASVDDAEQAALDAAGINCLRSFPGFGSVIWGARTLGQADATLGAVSARRMLIYLEQSIARGTAWAVFEPNDPLLWANVRSAIAHFLVDLWHLGGLAGGQPEEAFFVRCDRTTMTQADLDSGRLIALIGVALQRPGEFVIFRVGQPTADSRA